MQDLFDEKIEDQPYKDFALFHRLTDLFNENRTYKRKRTSSGQSGRGCSDKPKQSEEDLFQRFSEFTLECDTEQTLKVINSDSKSNQESLSKAFVLAQRNIRANEESQR